MCRASQGGFIIHEDDRSNEAAAGLRARLRCRYAENIDAASIAIAAAEETAQEHHALDEFAVAWHASRVVEGDAAAALTGAIAAVLPFLSDANIVLRTGVPIEAVRSIRSQITA